MRKGNWVLVLVGSLVVLASPATAGVPVTVTVTGEVEFNQINTPPPLGDVQPGETATMTFMVDSDVFDDDPVFPTRGYVIDEWSYSLSFDSADMELQDPFPAGQTPYFVIRNDDPAVDGFFTATNTAVPFGAGLPLNQTGFFEQFTDSFRVTYEGDALDSLDILDALGTYDFDGLTVFGWGINDGPFEPLFISFNEMTIEVIMPMDEDGDGILDEDDLCAGTVIPEGVPTHHLGTNRWALVDEDGIFDTTHPNGNGPGFMFDLEDTAGCSCEQIIEMLELGNGHTKFGCSNGAMMEWSAFASGADYDVDGGVVFDPVTSLNVNPTNGPVHLNLSGARTPGGQTVPTNRTKSADDRLAVGND